MLTIFWSGIFHPHYLLEASPILKGLEMIGVCVFTCPLFYFWVCSYVYMNVCNVCIAWYLHSKWIKKRRYRDLRDFSLRVLCGRWSSWRSRSCLSPALPTSSASPGLISGDLSPSSESSGAGAESSFQASAQISGLHDGRWAFITKFKIPFNNHKSI